jgi:hypothetical protein
MVLCPIMEREGLFFTWPGAHNCFMTITYPNGRVLEAIVLSHEEHDIRAIAAGYEDVLAFNCIHGTWISEELEPVTIEFGWQSHGAAPTPFVEDCICPQELAAYLIETLFAGSAPHGASWTRSTYSAQRDAASLPVSLIFNPSRFGTAPLR